MGASSLLNHDIDLVAIVHLEGFGRVVILDPLSIENEAALVAREALPLAVGIHELLELGRLLNLKENL